MSLDAEVGDLKYVVLFLNQQVACHNFNFSEVGFSQVNLLTLKEIDSFEKANIGFGDECAVGVGIIVPTGTATDRTTGFWRCDSAMPVGQEDIDLSRFGPVTVGSKNQLGAILAEHGKTVESAVKCHLLKT
jgi:hypothetical protein